MIITVLMQVEMGYLNSKFGSSVFFFCIAVYTRGCLVIYLLSITDWTSRLTLTAKVYIRVSVFVSSHILSLRNKVLHYEPFKCEVRRSSGV